MAVQSTSSLVIVSFWLGPQQYGLPVEVVREVVRVPALVALAGAAPTLCGLLNLRGDYLPVLDGRMLMGETPRYELSDQILIVGDAQPQLGLLVDQVNGVATFALADCTPIRPGVAATLLDSLINSEQGAIILLNLAALTVLAAEGQLVADGQAVAALADLS